ncbi:MAG: histidine kinase, partial [Friedmanniella sp.]|nr:histidine kinase [Friedmanniella sp.]
MTQRRTTGAASLARQILLLQVLVLAVVISAALLLAVSDARRTSQQEATARAVAVAVTVADSPTVEEGLAAPDPPTVLQPFAERVRTDTGTDFVVIMSPDGIRWTHPDRANIGKRFLGSISEAQQGRVGTELYTGTLGPSVRAVAPVVRGGRVVALVGAGITMETVNASLRANLPGLVL